jgi:hypothetical protein
VPGLPKGHRDQGAETVGIKASRDATTCSRPTALAMALRHSFSLASGDRAHRAAETATLEAITHLSALEFRSPMVPGLRFTGLHCTLVLKSDELISKLATVPEIEPAELVKLAPKEQIR